MTNGEHYRRRARNLVDLASDLDDRHRLPSTPAWDLRDLMAHLAGVAADVVAKDVDEYSQPSWTARQVAARAGRSRPSLIEEWEQDWPAMSQVLDDPMSHGLDAAFSVLPLMDVVAHEHDLRESTGVSGFADDAIWSLVEQRRRAVLAIQCEIASCGLEARTPDGDRWVLGPEEPRLTVTADRYELWRSLEGRRTRSVVAGFEWSADPDPILEYWVGSIFRWPEDTGA
jgi:uncharacterized protein (TIGR03083 family)